MTNSNEQSREQFVKITLVTARYILQTTKGLVSWLHGSNYDPETGRMLPQDPPDVPSLFEDQDKTDTELHQWLSQASMILKMIAGIVSFELTNLEADKENNEVDVPLGSEDHRQMPPTLYDDSYSEMGFLDEESVDLLYGAQTIDGPVWADEESEV